MSEQPPNRYEAAKMACEDALETARQQGRVDVRVEAQLELGELEREQGHLDPAQALFGAALDGVTQAPNRRQEGRARLGLAAVAFMRGDTAESWREVELAVVCFGDDEPLGYADCQLLIARLWLQRARYVDAEQAARRAIRASRQQGRCGRRALGRAWLMLGSVHYEALALPDMADAFETALRILEQLGDPRDLAEATRSAAIMLTANAPEVATTRFESAAALSREAGDLMGEARAFGDLGEVLRRLGRLDEAAIAFGREAKLMVRLGYERGQAQSDFHLASLAYLRGEHEDALKRLDRILPICIRLGTLGQVYVLELRGSIHAQ